MKTLNVRYLYTLNKYNIAINIQEMFVNNCIIAYINIKSNIQYII